VKGTSACGTRVALRGAPHDHRPRPVSTHLAQTICGEGTDSGDTGIEEVAKKRFNQLLPCSSSPHTPLNTGLKRRKKRLSRSPRLLLASGANAQAWVSGENEQELGGTALSSREIFRKGDLSKEGTYTQVCGSFRSWRWIAVHLLASFAPLGNLRSRITGCARPRGSARTSRLRMQKFVGGVGSK